MAVAILPVAIVITSVVITIVSLVIATGIAGIWHGMRFGMINWLFRHWIAAVILARLRMINWLLWITTVILTRHWWVHCIPRVGRAGSGNVQHLPGVNHIGIPQAVCLRNTLGVCIVGATNAVQSFSPIYLVVSATITTPSGWCSVGSRYKY